MFETDNTLIRKFISGDEKAFAALAVKWQHQILNFSYRFLGDEEKARDVLQEVLLRLYLSLKSFRWEAKFSTFLFRIMTNCCKDTLIKNRHEHYEISLDELNAESETNLKEEAINPDSVTPLDIVHSNDIGEKVRKSLMVIPENQRIVIIMKEYSQMRFSEIAQVMGMPESTVKSRMYKGLMNLKKILNNNGIKDWSDIE